MLKILSRIYGRVIDTRNVLYDFGIFRSYRVAVPVISIGNITVGGTGKTPMTILIAGLLAAHGERPAIISRGYKRKDEKSLVVVSDGEHVIDDVSVTGDEPLEMARELKGKASVVCDADRVRGASYAVKKLGATVLVLDDGFQHRRLRRNLDIVVVDSGDPFGSGRTLPSGRLRENLHNLSRADAVVITKGSAEDISTELIGRLTHLAPKAPVFTCSTATAKIEPLTKLKPETASGPFFVFCGIGNPERFLKQLKSEDVAITGSKTFPDHHVYTSAEMKSLEVEANASGATALLTTGKDAVKISQFAHGMPVYVVRSRQEIDDLTEFEKLILRMVVKEV